MEHKNEAPGRMYVWLDDIAGWLSSPRPQPGAMEMIRKDAACVEVREGYEAYGQQMNHAGGVLRRVPLSEALTIRTVEDVRREALMEAVRLLELPSGLMTPPAAQRIRNLIDTPAPSREKAQPVCPDCGNTGMRDSGGVYPWGEHIDVPCDCEEPQPTPSPEPAGWRARQSKTENWHLFEYRPSWWEVQPLYASPPTHASHAEELRKAKAEAWDEGYQWAYDGMSQRNPYRRRTDEGASHE